MTPTPEQLALWARLVEEAQRFGGKWYTAEELSERRAMSRHDARLIEAMSPATVRALIAGASE